MTVEAPPKTVRRLGGGVRATLRFVNVDCERTEVEDLGQVADRARKEAKALTEGSRQDLAVAFFDLSGSSLAKLLTGNKTAVKRAIAFTNLCSEIVSKERGVVIKRLGDGVLAIFSNPLDACRAALRARWATHAHLDLEFKAGVTIGRPLQIRHPGSDLDVLGDVVDRAARIQSLALAGQVLIDQALYTLIRSEFIDETDWRIDDCPRLAFAKGIGPLELFELVIDGRWELKEHLATPFEMDAEGRPALSQKLALLGGAQREIIEIGIGLTSFAQYFEGQKPEEFRDPIRQLVRGGVNLSCFALSPEYRPGMAWLAEQGNRDYPTEVQIARGRRARIRQ